MNNVSRLSMVVFCCLSMISASPAQQAKAPSKGESVLRRGNLVAWCYVQRTLTGKSNDLLKVVLPAASRGDLEAVCEIVAADRQWIHTVGPHNRTLLREAARKGQLETVRFLIRRGADVDTAACYYSESYVDILALCVAKANGHEDVAQLLQKHGATFDIHTHAYFGNTNETAAPLRKNPSLLYRDFGANPRSKPRYEATPLHYAVAGTHFDVCELRVGVKDS